MLIGYYNDTWWLLRGIDHLDDVLAATEAEDFEIRLVRCADWPSVVKLWAEQEEGKLPWAINPQIIKRVKTRVATIDVSET